MWLALCLQEEKTISQRKVLLAQKQEALRASVQELQDSIACIDWKQNFYDEVLSGKRPLDNETARRKCLLPAGCFFVGFWNPSLNPGNS